MSSNPKPTQSQQGSYNSGSKQGYNQYKGTKSGQSGSVGKSRGK